jgi:hypothetical protein
MEVLKIRQRAKKEKTGFGVTKTGGGFKFYEIEMNLEKIPEHNGQYDLNNTEIEEVIEVHHLAIRSVESYLDQCCIKTWCDQLSRVTYLSVAEFLAEMYVVLVDNVMLEKGATVARVKQVRFPGDNRVRKNSIGHVITEAEPLPKQILDVVNKYVVCYEITDGKQVTLRQRLYKDTQYHWLKSFGFHKEIQKLKKEEKRLALLRGNHA